jgi:hypothetical protein
MNYRHCETFDMFIEEAGVELLKKFMEDGGRGLKDALRIVLCSYGDWRDWKDGKVAKKDNNKKS